MERIDTVVVGGGQAGLAMSRSLRARGVEHVVLERGRVGERWRTQSWDSLRLLTPRWLSRLAGWAPEDGRDPHGFMDHRELIRYLERFGAAFDVPVLEHTAVRSVTRRGRGFLVETSSGDWRARHVVVATGQSQRPRVPEAAGSLAGDLHQVVPTSYRNPAELPSGGVLVVGASATGVQLADEIHRSGRPVTLSVGRHTRLPRRYRGRDILAWLHEMGTLDATVRDVDDLAASRDQPSMQLVGSPDHRTLDLRALHASGVRLVGRLRAADGSLVGFEDDLIETMAASELKLARLRTGIDAFVRERGLDDRAAPPEPFAPVPLLPAPTRLDLDREGIRTVLWATGFERSYPWLGVPVLDARGEIRHRGGVTVVPGLYVLGLNFMRRRSSSFLAGIGRDAEELADHLCRTRSSRAVA